MIAWTSDPTLSHHDPALRKAVFGYKSLWQLRAIECMAGQMIVSPYPLLGRAIETAFLDQPDTVVTNSVFPHGTPLNFDYVFIGHPGDGKGMAAQAEIIPWRPDARPGGSREPVTGTPGTGKNLIRLFFKKVDETDPNTGKVVARKYVRHPQPVAAFWNEGDIRAENNWLDMAARMRELRTGEPSGVQSETSQSEGGGDRVEPPYRFTARTSIQWDRAGSITGDEGGSFQRMMFFDTRDSDMDYSELSPSERDQLVQREKRAATQAWQELKDLLRRNQAGRSASARTSGGFMSAEELLRVPDLTGVSETTLLIHGPARCALSDAVREAARDQRVADKLFGLENPLDSHSLLHRIAYSAFIAGLRTPPGDDVTVEPEDWEWAAALWEYNRRVRTAAVNHVESVEKRKAGTKGTGDGFRALARLNAVATVVADVRYEIVRLTLKHGPCDRRKVQGLARKALRPHRAVFAEQWDALVGSKHLIQTGDGFTVSPGVGVDEATGEVTGEPDPDAVWETGAA